MHPKHTPFVLGQRIAISTLTAALVLATSPVAAFAATSSELQSQLEAAEAESATYAEQTLAAFQELEVVQAQLDDTKAEISSVESEIEDKQAELETAQDTLGERVSSNYKTGGVSLISILFDSSSFEDLVSRVHYASKVAASDAAVIKEVQDIQTELDTKKSELETKQAEQQTLVDEATSKADALQAAQDEHEAYVASLSADVQEALAAEEAARQAELERQAEEAAKKAAAEASNNTSSNTSSANSSNSSTANNNASSNSNSNNSSSNNSNSSNTSNNSNSNSNSSSNNSSSSESYGSGISGAISAARSKVGNSSYSYGASGPYYFDCSGLVWWAYKQAGISIPRGQSMSNGRGSSMIGWALDGGGWTTDASQLSAGDLMFWSYSGSTSSTYHVAMCIGGGLMIHCIPGGVQISSVNWCSSTFIGGGPVV